MYLPELTDRMARWLKDHPDYRVRPGDLAAQFGHNRYQGNRAARNLVATSGGEVVRHGPSRMWIGGPLASVPYEFPMADITHLYADAREVHVHVARGTTLHVTYDEDL